MVTHEEATEESVEGARRPTALGETPIDREAMSHAKHIAEQSGSSFLAGIRILPKDRRDGMYAVYAFCREVDDIVDEPRPLEEKRRLLGEWRREIDALYAEIPATLTGRSLVRPIARYDLQKQDLVDLIDGMEMDADERVTRGPDLKTLDLYCDRVASAVGRLSVRIFGDDGEPAQQLAHSLGRALQLTNILRDLREDAKIGRLYLPHELLERHGISIRNPGDVLTHPGLPGVCEDLAEIARRHFESASDALVDCSRRQMRPAILMMQVYRRLLDALQRRGWSRLDDPAKVSKAVKFWIFIRYGFI